MSLWQVNQLLALESLTTFVTITMPLGFCSKIISKKLSTVRPVGPKIYAHENRRVVMMNMYITNISSHQRFEEASPIMHHTSSEMN